MAGGDSDSTQRELGGPSGAQGVLDSGAPVEVEGDDHSKTSKRPASQESGGKTGSPDRMDDAMRSGGATARRDADKTMGITSHSIEVYDSDMQEEPPTFSLGLSNVMEIGGGSRGEGMGLDEVYFCMGNPSVQQFEGHLRLAINAPSGPNKRGSQLCVLAVPRYMSIADFYRFLGEHMENVLHMRIVHSDTPERYMCLIDVDTDESALAMYTEFNGKPYSSMDTEKCIVMFVSSVIFLDESPVHSAASTLKGTAFGLEAGQTELPSCPVCLERLDMSVTGIMTTICNHSFHCQCLSEWPDTSCPVCRYCQQPEIDQVCGRCTATHDLWMCVICGFVGCGRYVGEHALEHYKESHHNFSIELSTQRVWDYSGDNYVHRLVASKVDGKVVELPDLVGRHQRGKRCAECGFGNDEKDFHETLLQSKMESVLLEYNDMLTRTLEAQRHFFDGKLAVVQEQHDLERSQLHQRLQQADQQAAQRAAGSRDAEMERIRETLRKKDEETAELKRRVQDLEKREEEKDAMLEARGKELKAGEKKTAALSDRLKKAWEEIEFLQSVNKSVNQNQEQLRAKLDQATQPDDKDEEIKQLQEQVRDLMFYIEASKTLQESPDAAEIQQGAVSIGESPVAARKARRDRRAGKQGSYLPARH